MPMKRYELCLTHFRLWDSKEDCPCREFPISECRLTPLETDNGLPQWMIDTLNEVESRDAMPDGDSE